MVLEPNYNRLPPLLAQRIAFYWANYQAACAQKNITQPKHADFLSSLTRVWACSDFAVQTCLQKPELLTELFESGDMLREYPSGEYASRLALALFAVQNEMELMKILREFRRREMLRIAWRNLAGWANLNFTSSDLSELADACIQIALEKLALWLAPDFGLPLDKFGAAAPLIVIALGKLGSKELNFSSDVDLMFVYPEEGEFPETGRSFQQYYLRLGQQLIKVLSAFTSDGFVFRVDLRLRPQGSSGALVASFAQLSEYYKNQGRDWERYALIKARAITGSAEQQKTLSAILKNFVYQEYLDFGMIESLRQLQQKISREVREKDLHDNIKRGPGGIREIEFIIQTYKLVRGGLQKRLQLKHTIRTILILRDLRLISAEFADRLIAEYEFLRNIENALQMQNDQQTHDLPKQAYAQAQLSLAMGAASWSELTAKIQATMNFVHAAFEELIAKPQLQFENATIQARKKPLESVWTGKISAERAKNLLNECHFKHSEQILELLADLKKSPASQRLERELKPNFNMVVPYLLVLTSQEMQPDQTWSRVNLVLESLLSHPAYLALLSEHPGVMAQLVSLCGASPWIAEQISRHPILLDELLRPSTLYAPPGVSELKKLLDEHLISIPEDALEEQIQALHIFKQIHLLRIAAVDIMGILSLMKVSDYLTDLATVIVDHVLKIVWPMLGLQYGYPNKDSSDLGFAIIAYGKLGGIELGYGSDLDLVFVHDDQPSDQMTDGAESISTEQFYARLGQQLLTVLGTQTPAGRLYETDLRLRPAGNSGLLVPSISAFENYQLKQAWLWEHQALVRARVITGSKALCDKFDLLRRTVLSMQRDQSKLQTDVKQMRQRMRDAAKSIHPDKFDLKQGIGGIADIEFLVQYSVLFAAHKHPALMTWTDNIRILENMGIAGLIHMDEVHDLQKAYRSFRDTVHHLSLQNLPAIIDNPAFSAERALVTRIYQRLIG